VQQCSRETFRWNAYRTRFFVSNFERKSPTSRALTHCPHFMALAGIDLGETGGLRKSSSRYNSREAGWLFQILAEPRSQFVQFFGVGARDVLPLQCLRCCLKNSLLNMTIFVLAADDEADVWFFSSGS
jgi:hypothetical protein